MKKASPPRRQQKPFNSLSCNSFVKGSKQQYADDCEAGNESQTFTGDDVIDVGAEVQKVPLIPVTVSSGSIFAQCSTILYGLHTVWPVPFGYRGL